jgi:glucan 1,3-beta-glucosidase
VVKWNRTLAEEAMQRQLATWITEADFRQIAADGFTSVRLPVGYWNLIADPYHRFVPEDVEDSLRYVDFAFDMAERYQLSVLLDLHGAPGSQNGVDHSGCSLGANWLEDSTNVDLTLASIEAAAARYAGRRSLLGIELANEPAEKYCTEQLDALVAFYQKAYGIVRKYSRTCLIVFNELYEGCYSKWKNHLLEPEYYNVVMDLHLYNWQEPYTMQDAATHVKNAVAWEDVIADMSTSHPVMVGEWCFSTGTHVQAGQPFVDACVTSFHRAAGWYLWTWKVEPGIHFDEWDVQLQYSKRDGLRAVE